MPRIPDSFIQDLLTRVDIVELIGSRIALHKRGTNFVANCPFHSEKTPSFTVSQTKQFFHCFGCGAHGSAIGFLMQFEHLEFVAAVERLAAQIGISVPVTDDSTLKLKDLHLVMEQAAKLYKQALKTAPMAIDYLKKRGLSGKICQLFHLGYANNQWDNLKAIYQNNIAHKKNLHTTGLLLTKNQQVYARFRERIMYPIRNSRGAIIGFGGRTLKNDPAKYLNSPETPLFHKGSELYGLYEAKQCNNAFEYLIVVEGYMDVITLFQYGITNVVATLGTAISTKQIQTLLKNTREIVFCFDGDLAGNKAAWRALTTILPIMHDGITAKFLFLPHQDDPDSLIRKEGPALFIERIKSAIPLADFLFSSLSTKTNLHTIDGKSRLAKETNALLQTMPNSIFKQLLLEQLAVKLQLTTDSIAELVAKVPTTLNTPTATISPHLKTAISILLYNPQLVTHISTVANLATILLPDMDLFLELIKLLQEHPNFTTGAILEVKRDDSLFLERLQPYLMQEPLIPSKCLKNEFIGIINKLYRIHNEQTIEKLIALAAKGQLSDANKLELQTLIAKTKQEKID